jgi:hypothetical protein
MPDRIRLDTPDAAAAVEPALGGRVASLRLARPGFEFFPAAPFGVEDHFPSVGGGRYPFAPYEKVAIAEGGDVRSRSWQAETRDQTARLWVADKWLGYKLERRTSFAAGTVLRTEYRLDNVADEPLYFVWFARITLPLRPGVRLEGLPEQAGWTPMRASGPKAVQLAPLPTGLFDDPAERFPSGCAAGWFAPSRTRSCAWTDRAAGVRLRAEVSGGDSVACTVGLVLDASSEARSVSLLIGHGRTPDLSDAARRPWPHSGCGRLDGLSAREWGLELCPEPA